MIPEDYLGLGQASAFQGIQPQIVSPMLGGAFGGLNLRPNTVLSTEDRQARLGQAFDKMLESAIQGATPAERGEQVATDIFGKLIAPAVGAFGGQGTSQAGVDFMKQANAQVMQAKQQRRLNQATAFNGLHNLANIINSTSPESQKALAAQANAQLKDQQNQQNLYLGTGKINAQNARTQAYAQASQAREQRLGAAAQAREAHWKSQDAQAAKNFGLKQDALRQALTIANNRDSTLLQMTRLNNEERRFGTNATIAQRKKELSQKARQEQQEAITKAMDYNADVYAQFSEKDPKTGAYKRADAQGNPLDPTKFLIPIESIKLMPEDYADDPDMQAVIQEADAPATSKKLDNPNMARAYLQRAGGDPAKARELARSEGWMF